MKLSFNFARCSDFVIGIEVSAIKIEVVIARGRSQANAVAKWNAINL